MSIRKYLLPDEDLDAILRQPPITDQPSAWYGHIPFANWIVSKAKPNVLVELGTHAGVSYSAFCNAVIQAELPTRCYAIDTWQGDSMAGLYGSDVYSRFSRFHEERYSAFSTLLRSTFDAALSKFDDGSIDLLHIDGFHSYEAVRHDFETWQPKLSDRAVVLFHDTNERGEGFGVWRYWDELTERYPSFSFLHSHGLGVICYGDKASPSVRSLCDLDADATYRMRNRFQVIGERWVGEFRLIAQTAEIQERDNLLSLKEALILMKDDQIQSQEVRIKSAGKRIREMTQQLQERDHAVDALLSSTSWKITAPFRVVAKIFRRSEPTTAI